MKVLVTGATGFIGRHVIPCLLKRGHEITAVASDEFKARSFSWSEEVRFVSHDIYRDADHSAGRFGHQDALLHLAWVGLPNYKELFHVEETLPADYRFLKSMVQAGIGHLLVTGTCLEYGMRNGCLIEDMATQPSNAYGLAKDTLRKFLQLLQQRHTFTLQWARLFYMYGPGQNSNSLLAQLECAIETGEPAFNMSGGEQLRDYLSVEEVAKNLTAILEHSEFDGIVNVCSGTPISVRRLVEEQVKQSGAKIHLNLGHYAYPDHEPMAFWGDNSKLVSILQARTMDNRI